MKVNFITSFFLRWRLIASFAFRDILRNRVILIFNVVSLSTAFTAVFLTGGILGGFQTSLRSGAVDSIGDVVIVSSKEGENERIDAIDTIISKLNTVPNIKAFSVRSYSGGIIKYDSSTFSAETIIGVSIADENKTTKLPSDIIQGRFLRSNDTKSVVLGATLADALVGLEYDNRRIPVGKEIDITFLNGVRGEYTVVGILDAKTFQPNWMIYMNKSEVEKMDASKRDSQIAVKLDDSLLLERTQKEIGAAMDGIKVTTWKEESGYVDNIIEAVKFVTESVKGLLITSVFIIVGVTVFVNVFQRRRQIGILKSMGADDAFIVSIYLSEVVLYFCIAFLIGLILFTGIHARSAQSPIPLLIGDFFVAFDWNAIGVSGVILLVAAVGGSVIPALEAARTRVADVIREII